MAGILAADPPVALVHQHALHVVTSGDPVSDLLRRDWASKLRAQVSVPVLHVIGGTDEVIS